MSESATQGGHYNSNYYLWYSITHGSIQDSVQGAQRSEIINQAVNVYRFVLRVSQHSTADTDMGLLFCLVTCRYYVKSTEPISRQSTLLVA